MGKKLLCAVLAIVVCLGMFSVAAFGAENPPQIAAEAAVVMDAGTGQVLYEKNMDQPLPPSGAAKLMTAILALEALPQTEPVTVTAEALDKSVTPRDASHISLVVDETLTLGDLLRAMLIQTANDAANAIAIRVAGSIEAFAAQMTEKARALGCTQTVFTNATGMDADGNVSTAHDLALITRCALRDSEIAAILAQTEYTIEKTNKSAARDLTTGCAMLKEGDNRYERLTAGFSSWTKQAKYTCASAATKSEKSFVCVVLSGATTASRYTDSIALYEYAFNNFKHVTLKAADIPRLTVDVRTGGVKTGEVKLSYTRDVELWLYSDLSLLDLSVRGDVPEYYDATPTVPPDMVVGVNSDKMYATILRTPYTMETEAGVYTEQGHQPKAENGFVVFIKAVGTVALIALLAFAVFVIVVRLLRARRRKRRLEEMRRRERRRRDWSE